MPKASTYTLLTCMWVACLIQVLLRYPEHEGGPACHPGPGPGGADQPGDGRLLAKQHQARSSATIPALRVYNE